MCRSILNENPTLLSYNMPPNGSRVFAESIIRGCLHISRRRSSHQTHHRPSPGAILENLFHLRKLPSRALCTRVRYQPIEYVEDLSGYCHGGYHPVLIGDQLNGGRYRVVHKLGYGGYSTVWLALDLRANRYVAVKIITAGASEESRKAKLFSSFNDWVAEPGSEVIPSLIDEFWVSGPNGHHRCLITAPARMSLFDSKDASPCSLLQLNVARSIIAQLVYGVSFLHGQDIVHGGLFPLPSFTSLAKSCG